MNGSGGQHQTLTGVLLVPVVVGALALSGLLWLAGQLAALVVHQTWPPVGFDEMGGILAGYLRHPGDPAAAWPAAVRDAIPGPVGFYAVFAVLLVPVGAAWIWWLDRKTRRGQPRSAASASHWATAADLKSLRVEAPVAGRVTLGRHGKHLIAAAPRQSVIIFGPTQTGKTTGLAIPAILEWDGPVLCTSVKSDLLKDTIAARQKRGDTYVYDPTGSTGLESCGWTPLASAATWKGAQQVAAWMCDAARASGSGLEDSEFWFRSAAKLLAPVLFAAARQNAGMDEVIRWIDSRAEHEIVDALAQTGQEAACNAFFANVVREERTKSSVYTTAETVLAAYADPGVLATSSRSDLTPRRLLDGSANTAYVCAPAHEQRRLQPLLAALVSEIVFAVYQHAARHGPLDPPLLLVLDECANIAPIPELPTIAATGAGQGIQLVTVFQDMSQIDAVYGTNATPTIVSNHAARLVLSSIADPRTLEYAERLLGNTLVAETTRTRDHDARESTTESLAYRKLAPAATIRQIPPGRAVLLYGHLPPAEIRLRPWYDEADLRALAHPNAKGRR